MKKYIIGVICFFAFLLFCAYWVILILGLVNAFKIADWWNSLGMNLNILLITSIVLFYIAGIINEVKDEHYHTNDIDYGRYDDIGEEHDPLEGYNDFD